MMYIQKYLNLEVNLNDSVIEKLVNTATRFYPNETGGILVGNLSKSGSCLIVEDIWTPHNSTRSKHVFYRSSDGLLTYLNNCSMKSPRLHYVGEWHSHPDGSVHPSRLDLLAMNMLASSSFVYIQNPLLLIIGLKSETSEIGLYVSSGNQLYPYEILS